MKVRYAGNKYDQKELYNAIKCITENWWALGDKGLQFERQFSKIVDRKYGVFLNSGSSSNFLAIQYVKKLGYKKVITPVCGFPTTINPIIQHGLQPLFIDIDRKNLNLDIKQLEKVASQNLGSVLFFAHALGNIPDMNKIMQIVQKYNLYLIEDCCDALGTTFNGKNAGTFGKMSTYSFYPAHHITTGEGGFIATNDSVMYKSLVSFRDWGRDCTCRGKNDAMKQNGRCNNRYNNWLPGLPELEWDHKYCYSQMGYNLKPIELQAVLGLQQIKKIPQFEKIRKNNYNTLKKELSKYSDYLQFPQVLQNADVNWFCFPITLKQNIHFNRKDFINYLEKQNVETRLYFAGNILYQKAYVNYVQDNYQGNYELIHTLFPNSKYITENTLFIGVSQVIDEQQIKYVCQKIKQFMGAKAK